MYGIIGAMQGEIDGLLGLLVGRTERRVNGVLFYTGRLGGCEVAIARSGVGKVSAAMTAALLIREFAPEAVINTGVSGALSPTLSVGDLALATALVEHDMDTSALGDPVGYLSGLDVVYLPADGGLLAAAESAADALGVRRESGVIASGDQFISDRTKKERIRDTFGAISCEMEGAAIAHVCYAMGVPVAVVRTVSDKADGSAEVDFPTFAAAAAVQSCRVTAEMLRLLSEDKER